MRIHRLEMQAIGPYAGHQTIDFDELTGQGLFLLTGPTGAGKTTILDAVVFALYGSVPGARAADGKRDARRARERLVSTLRPVDTKPYVELEFTAAGRRVRINRSPDHDRPKARGTGTTTQPATVTLEWFKDGEWRPGSTSFDEAGIEIGDLLGMSAEQFSQVVLLPQGEFAGFLRAKVDDRRAVLERLFAVGDFKAAERWFDDQAREAKSLLAGRAAALDRVVHRLEGALPDQVAGHDAELPETPPPGAEAPVVDAWLAAWADITAAAAGRAAAAGEQANAAEREAQRALDAMNQLTEAQRALGERSRQLDGPAQRLQRAREWVAEHAGERLAATPEEWAPAAAAAGEHAASLEQLARAERDLPQQLERAARAEAEAEAAEQLAARADAREHEARTAASDLEPVIAAGAHAEGELPGARQLHEQLAARVQAIDALAGLAAELAAAEASEESAREADAEATQTLDAAPPEAELDALAAELATLQQQLAADESAHRAALAALAADQSSLAADRERRERAEAQLAERMQERVSRGDVAQSAYAAYLEAKEERLDAMASELARELQAGEPCPVCGSTDHPLPAQAPGGDDLRAREAAAQAEHEAAMRALGEAEQQVAASEALLASLDADALHAREAGLRQRSDELARTTTDLRERGESLAARLTAHRETSTRRRMLVQRCEEARRTHADASSALARLRETAAAHRAKAGDGDAAALRRQLDQAATRMGECAEAARAGTDAREQHQLHLQAASVARAASAEHRGAAATAREAARQTHELIRQQQQAFVAARGTCASVAEAATAARSHAGHLSRAAQVVADHKAARAEYERASALVAERAGSAAPLAGEPDDPIARLAHRRARRDEAAQTHRTAAARQAQADECVRAVASAAAELTRVRDESGEAAIRAERICRLDRVVHGQGDNTRKISLTTFVLAARLEEVAAAASHHLARMSDNRYELVHHDEREGGGQAGLGLRVLDGWTGEERDTATLSGGEAFYASLALALGLAEVVTGEAGGRPLETLLVDEGFGSLDPDTLEDVLGVLDQLRAAGRAIGLVSHVPAMAERIPAQLRVRPAQRGGSTVEVVTV